MKREIELLAPGGDVDSIKAAILAGANAIYCGLDRFNARNRAANISFENLQGILRLAHKNSCEIFLTLNIIVVDDEIPALIGLLNKLINTSIDGLIVQDLGMFYLLSNYIKGFKIHASTQLTTHNKGQIQFLSKLAVNRVNLSRELNIKEIKALSSAAAKNDILTEVFVHGSYCISFSGICYMSSVQSGKSGNRGRCSQPCRERYSTTSEGKNFPLNLKDNSAYFDLKDLVDAGVYSLKIEGRIKEFEYVYTVVNAWNKQLESYYTKNKLLKDNSELYTVFNRDFSNYFLKGDINKEMFIDDPMSYSTKRLSDLNKYATKEELLKEQIALYKGKEDTRSYIKSKIEQLSIEKIPLIISISGESGTPLQLSAKTPDSSFILLSEIDLVNTGTEALTHNMFLKRLKVINDSEYYIKQLEVTLRDDLYLPFKELTSLKRRLLFNLNDSIEFIDPIEIPSLKKQERVKINPALSVLISSQKDLHLINETDADIYYQLPNSIGNEYAEYLELFSNNKKIIPYFPSVLIGKDFSSAVELLKTLNARLIVTNNTGIAYEAYKLEIPWIAGPYLNIINSYSLLTLKENFNCRGAFISNELSKRQIKSIKKPADFKLYYSIYHPIVLMTSRQCLFHQITGCEKNKIEDSCIQSCNKFSSITNLREETSFIKKTKGNYHSIYHETHFLNTEIVTNIQHLFSGFSIDLRDLETNTKTEMDKTALLKHFKNFIDGNPNSRKELIQSIHPITNTQYKKGI